jgi:hypothetical protein
MLSALSKPACFCPVNSTRILLVKVYLSVVNSGCCMSTIRFKFYAYDYPYL